MSKKIEVVSASDPQALKQQLQQMVNVGWIIKGVVNQNTNNANSEPFVILERDSVNDPSVDESFYENENPSPEFFYTKPEPPRKEISISMS